MSVKKDWLPTTRDGILAMSRDWIMASTAKKTVWNIPGSMIVEMTTLRESAAAALEVAKNETTRTPVATAYCKEAFAILVDCMRDCKRRYFLTPPLFDPDYISLGLKPRDNTPTPSGTPTAQVTIETYLVGRHELGIVIIYVTGDPNDAANKSYRVWFRKTSHGEAAPASPGELSESFSTKRRKDVIEFDYEDSGKTVHMAVQIENDGKKGPWGPLVSALIP